VTQDAVLAAACVGVVIAAIWGAIMAIIGRPAGKQGPFRTRATRVRSAGTLTLARGRSVRLLAAVAAGVGVWLFTGWPVGGAMTTALVLTAPFFFGGARVANERIERLEALEQWVRTLSNTMAVGVMPIQAITRSAAKAPLAIRRPVAQLANHLSTPRLDRTEVLDQFADDIDDALGDIVVLALERAVSIRGGERVPYVLETLAASTANEVKARRAVEKERSGPRKETQTICIILALAVAALCAFTSYPARYAGSTGQTVLVVLGAVVLLALGLMRRLSIGGQPPRILNEREGARE